jgi:hypothetical protein
MKNMKKYLCVMLSLVMALSFGAAAFAADDAEVSTVVPGS